MRFFLFFFFCGGGVLVVTVHHYGKWSHTFMCGTKTLQVKQIIFLLYQL